MPQDTSHHATVMAQFDGSDWFGLGDANEEPGRMDPAGCARSPGVMARQLHPRAAVRYALLDGTAVTTDCPEVTRV